MSDTPEPIQQTPENIEEITQQLIDEGFLRDNIDEEKLFKSVLQGRVEGYTKKNCPHPSYVLSQHSGICTQCGYEDFT